MWRAAPSGLSGARVWCGERSGGPGVALKAWPAGTDPDRLRHIHAQMMRAAQLPFIPTVLRGRDGSTVCAGGAWVCDCCRWMPGVPRARPTAAEVAAACAALAELHAVWAVGGPRGPCPGVRNRLRLLTEVDALLRAGPAALPAVSPDLDPLLRRAVAAGVRYAPDAARALEPWIGHPFALHPCVRDLRGEHVLFDGPRVSGIVDYGAVAVDHAAVDLARLLGDFAPAGAALFAAGLSAYRAARPAFDAPDAFVRVLTRTGIVCSVLGWLVRCVVRREPVSDPAARAARLAALLARLDEGTRF
jgi:homoserine kinase type II